MNTIKQRFTTFLAPGTSFVEDNFSMGGGRGGVGVVQVVMCSIVGRVQAVMRACERSGVMGSGR